MRFKLRRTRKENYIKVGESTAGIGLQIVKIVCSLEGGHTFRRRGLKGGISKVQLT